MNMQSSLIEGQLLKAAKLDRGLALIVVLVPLLGTVLAVWLAIKNKEFAIGATEVSLFLMMYSITIIGIEIGYHRYFAHSSFKTKLWFQKTLAIFGSMAFQGPVIWWVATHRRHHHKSDEKGDPHSPHITGDGKKLGPWRGFFHSHIGWLFQKNSTRPSGWGRYTQDLYRKEHVFNIHMNYFFWLFLGFFIPTFIGLVAHQSWQGAVLGFLWGGLVRVFFVHHFIWSLNSICHLFGKSPYKTKGDKSTNLFLLALPTIGQGWHNNHHAFPQLAKVGMHWWQIDIGAMLLKILEKLGVVWDVKRRINTDTDKL